MYISTSAIELYNKLEMGFTVPKMHEEGQTSKGRPKNQKKKTWNGTN